MDLKAQGLKALVTGGSRGIGRAIVAGLLDEGVDVSFCARDEALVEQTRLQLSDRGPRLIGSSIDVGDAEALAAWVDRSAQDLGGIDIVVSNVSALAIPDTEENWEASINVDLMGTVRLIKSAMPYLEKSQAASIVTISSVSGRESDFASGPYGTVKTALIGYTQGLALQLAGKGIRANTVSPGNTYFPGGVWEQIKEGNRDLYDLALGLNPTGRMGTPEEMAAAVVFLSSPISSFTTGTNLVVDGALTRGIQV
jgi:NAD(P)-dependent dehydrogenase (short-subunit alcohol dehydrogenase family)